MSIVEEDTDKDAKDDYKRYALYLIS